MLKIWKIVAAGAGLWAVLRLFYGWKLGQGARAASIICHTCTRHSFTCCTHSKHGSEPADKRARRFLETQDLGRENSRPARRAYVALPGAALTPCYCRLLGCMNLICLCQSELVHAGRRPASQRRCCLGAALTPAPPSPSKKSVTEPDLNRSQCTSEVLFKATSGVVLGISAHAF